MNFGSYLTGLLTFTIVTLGVQVWKHGSRAAWNKPIVESVQENKVVFDLTPIPMEYRNFCTHDAWSVYMYNDKLHVRFRDMKTGCIEINQHHFWTKDLLIAEASKEPPGSETSKEAARVSPPHPDSSLESR